MSEVKISVTVYKLEQIFTLAGEHLALCCGSAVMFSEVMFTFADFEDWGTSHLGTSGVLSFPTN